MAELEPHELEAVESLVALEERRAAIAGDPSRVMHACTLEWPEVPSDAMDNLCGRLGLFAEELTEDLDKVTCLDCLRAIAKWGQLQRQALCGRLWWLAAVAVSQVDDWLGMASTRAAAEDCWWRLKRALEGSHFGSAYLGHEALHWRGEQFHAEERAGFRVGADGEVRRILPGQKPWEHGAGPTLAEELERLRYERDQLREELDAAELRADRAEALAAGYEKALEVERRNRP